MSKIQLNQLSTQLVLRIFGLNTSKILTRYQRYARRPYCNRSYTIENVFSFSRSNDRIKCTKYSIFKLSAYNTFNRKRFTMFRCCDNYFVGKTIFVIYINNSLNICFSICVSSFSV